MHQDFNELNEAMNSNYQNRQLNLPYIHQAEVPKLLFSKKFSIK